MRFILLLFLACGILYQPVYADECDLTVHLQGINSARGQIQIELYSDAKAFRKSALALRTITAPAHENTVTVKFTGIQSGLYALLAFHDEDGNGLMNKRFGMIPVEGYALSNDPKVFGPPTFKDSAFSCAESQELSIPMHYQ